MAIKTPGGNLEPSCYEKNNEIEYCAYYEYDENGL